MAVRREKVVLELEDRFSTGMARAAAAAAALDKNLDGLDGTMVNTSKSTTRTSSDVDGLGNSLRRNGAEIDKFSGRLRLALDAAAVFGPSLVPIGAVAVPAVTGLASQLGFATIGMSSLVVASQGVGDALKAVNEAALEPTAKNLEKAHVAMERLGPAAQMFVAEFQELRPVLGDIRDAAAAGWFPGLTESLDSIEAVGPRVAAIFEKIGRVGGDLVAEGAAGLAGPEWEEFLQFVETAAPKALEELGRSTGNAVRGLAELWMAFDPLNTQFSSWLLGASRDFAAWADGLAATEGFQDFVSYIETNGPRVADALGAVGSAVVEIVEAIAPLGGPSLQIIETFAKVVGAIADSDLGTPILAGVAALAALNRTLRVTAALEARMTGSSAIGAGMATGGLFGGLRGAQGSLKGLNTDMRTTILRAGKTTAAIGGLTLAATGAADGFGLSNTASLGLMGTIAGPWGTALGAGAGAMLDLRDATDIATTSTESFNAALRSGDAQQMRDEIRAIEDDLAGLADFYDQSGVGDAIGDFFTGLGGGLKILTGQEVSNSTELERRKDALESQAEATRRAALNEAGFSDALIRTGDRAGFTSAQLLEMTGSVERASATAWGAIDAQVALDAAMDAVADAAQKGKRGIDSATEGGRENLTVLSGMAGQWEATRRAMIENEAPTKRIEARYREVRAELIRAALKMGATRGEAIKLADQLAKPMSIVIKEKHREAVSNAKAAIAQLRRDIEGRPITQTVNVKVNGKNVKADVGAPGGLDSLLGGRAYGGYTGHGGKFDPAGIVHRGEVVIPRELVQRDRPELLAKYGHLAGMDQLYTGGLAGYAGGGRVGGSDGGATDGLRNLGREANESTKHLRGLRAERDKLERRRESLLSRRSNVMGGVATGLISDPWEGDEWSAKGSPLSMLRGDIREARAFRDATRKLKRKGVKGNALAEILADGDLAQAQQAASMSRADLREYSRLYAVRASVVGAAGRAAGSAAYGPAIAQVNRELREIRAAVNRGTRTNSGEQDKNRRSQRSGAGAVARSRPRGSI